MVLSYSTFAIYFVMMMFGLVTVFTPASFFQKLGANMKNRWFGNLEQEEFEDCTEALNAEDEKYDKIENDEVINGEEKIRGANDSDESKNDSVTEKPSNKNILVVDSCYGPELIDKLNVADVIAVEGDEESKTAAISKEKSENSENVQILEIDKEASDIQEKLPNDVLIVDECPKEDEKPLSEVACDSKINFESIVSPLLETESPIPID